MFAMLPPWIDLRNPVRAAEAQMWYNLANPKKEQA